MHIASLATLKKVVEFASDATWPSATWLILLGLQL